MKTELLGQEKNKVRIKVEFEVEEFSKNFETVLREIAQKVNFPGFRKGHAPRRIIEMRFGRENLYGEALEKMVPDAIAQIVDDYDLETIATPTLEVETIRDGEPPLLTLTFEVLPEVVLPNLEEIEVEKTIASVSDAMLDAMVSEFRKTHSTLTAVDRAATEGDVISVTFTTSIVAEDAPPPSATEESEIDLDNPAVRREFRDGLLGKSKDEETSVEFVVDENYQDASWAGKKIRYAITVQEVKERIYPPMDADFFKKVLSTEVSSEEAFRDELKKRLTRHLEDEYFSQASKSSVEQITKQAVLEVPETLQERQVASMKERDIAEAKRRYGKSFEEFLRDAGLSQEEYEKTLQGNAEEAVRQTLVLEAIGKKFEVEIEKKELDEEIERSAAYHGMESAQLRTLLFKDQQRILQTVDQLRFAKIRRLIMEKIKVKDVEKPATEQAFSEI